MYRSFLLFFIFLSSSLLTPSLLCAQTADDSAATVSDVSEKKTLDFVFRLGQGGFKESRSPEGALGGGQLALDLKLSDFPVALSFSSESYTNGPDPTHSYEISSMYSLNLLYTDQLYDWERVHYFAGGGVGQLNVPKGETISGNVKSVLYDLEAGIRVRAFWKIGVYGAVKYLYAQKESDGIKVIDYNNAVFLLGMSIAFSL